MLLNGWLARPQSGFLFIENGEHFPCWPRRGLLTHRNILLHTIIELNMANTYSQIYLQFVFSVKHRQCLIPKHHKDELHRYITGLVQNRNAKMLAVHCMPDHTH